MEKQNNFLLESDYLAYEDRLELSNLNDTESNSYDSDFYILLIAFCFGMGVGVVNLLMAVAKHFIASAEALHWMNIVLHFFGIFFLMTAIYLLIARLVRRHRPNLRSDFVKWMNSPLVKKSDML